MRNRRCLTLLLLAVLALTGGCRQEGRREILLVPVGWDGDLADRPVTPAGLSLDDRVTVSGLLTDTGALTFLTDFNWTETGLTRTVYFLTERQPGLDDIVVTLEDARVVELGKFGYGVGLEGGTLRLHELPEPTRPTADTGLVSRLSELDLDALSRHPEHNGGYRPTPGALAALGWSVVDLCHESAEPRYLLRSARLSLPPFADPRISRWLKGYALITASGVTEIVWVGVRGSFAE